MREAKKPQTPEGLRQPAFEVKITSLARLELKSYNLYKGGLEKMPRRMNASQARAAFAEAVNRVVYGGERTIIRRHGRDVAAVVPMKDLKTLEALEDRLDLEEARKIMKKPGRLIAWEKIKADLGL
ncbi:MAG: type II toxin-antitoxin system prevent-host-death family antitoxin [Acidobacteria bacterium]|nr:MAG: type II toxin-antitoxin system prevent-host-death family antitoxin [Acidobacteriota bacterium]